MLNGQRVLLIEDSVLFAQILGVMLKNNGYEVDVAPDKESAVRLIKENHKRYFIAIVDMNIPGASNGAMLDITLKVGIPSIVFSGEYDEKIRDSILKKNVIDYIIKDSPASSALLVRLVDRAAKNRMIKVLVVDDSNSARYLLTELVRIQQFQALEASNGEEALAMLLADPQIRILITDYNMPKMDGFQLIKKIRAERTLAELAIIGISATGKSSISARFLKYGANDYIKKPFEVEEFSCRINLNAEMLERLHGENA